ncbi:hypothetical protein [uncultured Nostoc sp.]|uniref:hypothetical protein n=1 Tax=uncultured Nostoc sp. TaxID=340711 RepID=UPI0035C9EA14
MGSQYFDIKPVAGRIGAEIIGVNLSSNLSDDTVTIVGDLPVGIDGKQSEGIKGDASKYNRRQAVTA